MRFLESNRLGRRAFTLSEVIIAATIFVIMIALVMGMVIYQSKFGISIGNYSDMNEYSRKAVTQFESDMRLAREVTAISATEVTIQMVSRDLSLADAVTRYPKTEEVRYIYDKDAGKLYRESPAKSGRTTVLENLIACEFLYFNRNDAAVTNMADTKDVKKILLSSTMRRNVTGISNTDYLVSAVVTLRSRP